MMLGSEKLTMNECLGLNLHVNYSPRLRIKRAETANTDSNGYARSFFTKVKVAIVKALILSGYTTFVSLLGDAGFVIASREIAQILSANPMLIVLQVVLVFGSTFFTKLKMELNIKDAPYF